MHFRQNLAVQLQLKSFSAVFSIPLPTRQGTLGRNALRGFPVNQLDFALHRQFSLTERWTLQSSAEFFNVFNHPNLAEPEEQSR